MHALEHPGQARLHGAHRPRSRRAPGTPKDTSHSPGPWPRAKTLRISMSPPLSDCQPSGRPWVATHIRSTLSASAVAPPARTLVGRLSARARVRSPQYMRDLARPSVFRPLNGMTLPSGWGQSSGGWAFAPRYAVPKRVDPTGSCGSGPRRRRWAVAGIHIARVQEHQSLEFLAIDGRDAQQDGPDPRTLRREKARRRPGSPDALAACRWRSHWRTPCSQRNRWARMRSRRWT
jgi:hypothetical protein